MIELRIIGENIRKERKKKSLTIEKLAEIAGITDNYLGKIERGCTMSLNTLDCIATALNVSIDYLNNADEYERNAEYKFINSLVEINNLTEENKAKFFDFISANVKYFK